MLQLRVRQPDGRPPLPRVLLEFLKSQQLLLPLCLDGLPKLVPAFVFQHRIRHLSGVDPGDVHVVEPIGVKGP